MAYLKSLSKLCLFAYMNLNYAAMDSFLKMCIPYATNECMKRCDEGKVCQKKCHEKVIKPCKDAYKDFNLLNL